MGGTDGRAYGMVPLIFCYFHIGGPGGPGHIVEYGVDTAQNSGHHTTKFWVPWAVYDLVAEGDIW